MYLFQDYISQLNQVLKCLPIRQRHKQSHQAMPILQIETDIRVLNEWMLDLKTRDSGIKS